LQIVYADFRTVTRVIDGDTLVLDKGEKIRLIGIDTPETKDPRKPVQYFGQEATNFTRQMVEGKKVWVEFDQANSATAHKDKYGRTLGYVFREDGKFLNAEIISQGYGQAYTKYPFKYANEFRALEQQARSRNIGLWNASAAAVASSSKAAAPQVHSNKEIPQDPSTTDLESTQSYAGAMPQARNGAGSSPTGKTLYFGPKGGVYHYSASGNKVYQPRTSR
jgi:endonuclease YncB( thermonuclease family)